MTTQPPASVLVVEGDGRGREKTAALLRAEIPGERTLAPSQVLRILRVRSGQKQIQNPFAGSWKPHLWKWCFRGAGTEEENVTDWGPKPSSGPLRSESNWPSLFRMLRWARRWSRGAGSSDWPQNAVYQCPAACEWASCSTLYVSYHSEASYGHCLISTVLDGKHCSGI